MTTREVCRANGGSGAASSCRCIRPKRCGSASTAGDASYPFAVKIATGKINAVSGEPWTPNLNRDPQDYVVIPEQPWLDGYCVEKGSSGSSSPCRWPGLFGRGAAHGRAGMGRGADPRLSDEGGSYEKLHLPLRAYAQPLPDSPMGLAPGGRMKQEVYDDPYGLDAWDQRHFSRCFVTIANSVTWHAIIGERPPEQLRPRPTTPMLACPGSTTMMPTPRRSRAQASWRKPRAS